MKIGIGNDHTACHLKEVIKEYLESQNYEVIDFGTNSCESCDYPEYGYKVAKAIQDNDIDKGVLICGTGLGISLAANKMKGIRAAVCSEPYTAELSVKHNDANIIAFGARVVGDDMAKMIVKSFFDAKFEGGRHEKRVGLIKKIEENGQL